MQSFLQGRSQSRPFLPVRSKQRSVTSRVVSTCKCSLENSVPARRTFLTALLSLGFAAEAQAKTAAPAKKDAYQELQEIVKGRTGSTSLLNTFKADNVQNTLKKGVVEPFTSSPQKAALAKPASSAASSGPSAEVLGGLGLLGLIGAVTASNSGKGKGKPAATKKPAFGTQRVGAPAPAKQAARKVASAGTKVFGGTQKTAAPVKQVKKVAAQAQATAKPAAGGLFGTRKVGPAVGTKKLANKAAQPVQKAKAVTKQASKQATRKVQAGAGSLKDALNEDTGSTIGAAGVVGLAVVVAGALVLGTPKPAPKPATPAPRELAPKPAKKAAAAVQAAVKEAPKLAEKVTPQPPSLPTLPSPPTPPPPPPVTAEKPKVPSGPELIPEAVKKPETPSTPPPTFPKPRAPSGPDLRISPPAASQAKVPAAPAKAPAATVAAAPAAAPVAPATYGVLALAVAGVAAAAVANKGEDRAAPSASAQAPAPTPAATSSADGNSPEAIAQRKAEARKWIDDWRAKQK